MNQLTRPNAHKRLFISLVTLFTGLFVAIPSWAQQEEITIKGVILDSLTNETVPYATVAITPKRGTETLETLKQVTDDGGRFTILLPHADEYSIVGSFVGKRMNPLIVPYSRAKMGATIRVKMADKSEELGTVTVTAARPLVRLDADRIAYSVKDDPMSKSENLRDMLRRVPLVTVDGEGKVQVKGSSNFQIFINGKPSTMINSNPKEILRSIPASSIKKVEVITDPGVKYDAEGVSAILNIVTEAATLEGYAGSVTFAGSPLQPLASPSLFFTTKIGKFGLTTNYNYWIHNSLISPTTDIEFTIADRVQKEKNKTQQQLSQGHNGSITLTYDFNPYNLLSSTTSFNLYNTRSRSENPTTVMQGEALLSDYTCDATTRNTAGNLETDISFQHSTDLEKELFTLSYRFLHNPQNDNSSYTFQYFRLNGMDVVNSPLAKERTQSKAALNEHTAQIDYTRPFGEHHLIDVGMKAILRRGTSRPLYELFNPTTNTWEKGTLFGGISEITSSPMDYRQNIFGLYANYTLNVAKVSLVTGIRAEKGFFNVQFADKAEANFNRSFLDWVPQLTLSYKLTDMQQLKLSYNYRVSRPNITQLNPYKSRVSSNMTSQGNPDINNAKLHNVDLGYNYYSQKLTLMASLQSSFSNNNITQVILLDKDDSSLLRSTWGNYGQSLTVGGNLFINYVPTPWLRLYTNLNLNHHTLEAPDYPTAKGWSGISYLGALLTLPKKWTVGINGGFFAQAPELSRSSAYGSWHNFSASKTLFSDKLTLSAWINNPFTPYQTFKVKTRTNNFEQDYRVRQFMFTGGISLSYSFGEMKSQIRKVQRTIVNEDLDTNKGGGVTQGIPQQTGNK